METPGHFSAAINSLTLSSFVRDHWPPIKIIVTSGKLAPSAAALPRDGVFLPKPYSPTSVATTIHDLLGSS